MNKRWTSLLVHWAPAIAWAISIFVFSTNLFSGENTARYLIPFLRWLMPGAQWSWIFAVHDAIRKVAHFVEYFILSWLVFRGFRGDERGWRFLWSFWTVALVVGYSTLDEVHQSFVPSRSGSLADVMIDSLGTVGAQVLLWARHRRK